MLAAILTTIFNTMPTTILVMFSCHRLEILVVYGCTRRGLLDMCSGFHPGGYHSNRLGPLSWGKHG